MPQTTVDPRWTQIESIILTYHAVKGDEPDAPSQVVKNILEAVMLILTTSKADARLWQDTFEILGLYHPGLNRFDIILAVLNILGEVESRSWADARALAVAWICSISGAKIHPVSLALCTTYKFDRIRILLVSLVDGYSLLVEIFPEIQHGKGVDFWKLQIKSHIPQSNILAVGTLLVFEAKSVHITCLGDGWAVGGDLELLWCRDITSLGPDLTVFRHLGLHCCYALKKVHDPVRVGFRILETSLETVDRKSGYAGIQSNLGYYYMGRLFRPRKGKLQIRTNKAGKALLVPNSLAQLSKLCGP